MEAHGWAPVLYGRAMGRMDGAPHTASVFTNVYTYGTNFSERTLVVPEAGGVIPASFRDLCPR